ncbi:hypothetical protein AB0F88_17140 [Streptosporangium sp. NPDC023963]|uniref:hypothetical protein n=1 Tax=Streptosporangium sp. NPDC023963 TaxID=3155608 RepID=UPI00343DC89C
MTTPPTEPSDRKHPDMTSPDTATPTPDQVLTALTNQAWQAADQARREHLQRCLALAAHRIREHFPAASRIAADFSHAIPHSSRGPRVSLVSVHGGRTTWHRESDVPGIGLTRHARERIESALTDAMRFGVDHQVLNEAGWRHRPYDFSVRDIDLPPAAPGATAPGPEWVTVWALKFDDGSPSDVVLHGSCKAAIHGLAIEVRERWAGRSDPDLPATPPDDDQDAVDAFFGVVKDEWYWLHAVTIPAAVAATLTHVTVWVLHHDTDARTTGEVTVHGSEEKAVTHLAGIIRETWDRVADDAHVPEPPEDDKEAVELYFKIRRRQEGDESYTLHDVELPGPFTAVSEPSAAA